MYSGSSNIRTLPVPDPTPGGSAWCATAPEPLEHASLLVGGDARAAVGDGDRCSAVGRVHENLDLAALGRELHRVAEQVREHLTKPRPVAQDGHRRELLLKR